MFVHACDQRARPFTVLAVFKLPIESVHAQNPAFVVLRRQVAPRPLRRRFHSARLTPGSNLRGGGIVLKVGTCASGVVGQSVLDHRAASQAVYEDLLRPFAASEDASKSARFGIRQD